MADRIAEIAGIAAKLTEAQRAFLLRYEPTLDEQPVSEAEVFSDLPLYVELAPQVWEQGCLVDPGAKAWFAGSSAESTAGSSAWDRCTIKYNETGLKLRAHIEQETRMGNKEMEGRSPADAGSGCQPSGDERWLPVVGYEGLYEVSSLGRIRSRYAPDGHVLSTAGTDKDGYPVVSLSAPDGRRTWALHRIVAVAFHGPPRPPHREVAHLDGSRTNACADNLKWVGRVQNHFHMRAHGTHPGGENHPQAKLTADDVRQIRAAAGNRIGAALGRKFGVDRSTVSQIRRGLIWREL